MVLRPDCATLIALQSVKDAERGTLCVAEYSTHVPFEIRRVFYLYDLPKGIVRGQHAHRKQGQFLICLTGSIELTTVRKDQRKHFTLSRPDEGVYLPPLTWLNIKVQESNTLCLVIASGSYDENDYIRNYAAFETLLKEI